MTARRYTFDIDPRDPNAVVVRLLINGVTVKETIHPSIRAAYVDAALDLRAACAMSTVDRGEYETAWNESAKMFPVHY